MLFTAVMLTWLGITPLVGQLWITLFRFWHDALELPGRVVSEAHEVLLIRMELPVVELTAGVPDTTTLVATAAVTGALFIASLCLPGRWLPFCYILRALLFIQATALVYFGVAGEAFPYSLSDYIHAMLVDGLALISLVPVIFLLTYYTFDFSGYQKVALTLLTMGHLVVFIPLQLMLQLYLLWHLSSLFMPLMFLVFGVPLQILLLITFYGWGMTWHRREPEVTP